MPTSFGGDNKDLEKLEMGRKTTKTTILKKQFLEAYELNGCHLHLATRAANIHRGTVWAWRKEDPEFDERMVELEEALLDDTEAALLKKVRSGSIAAITYLLDRRGKSRGYGNPYTSREWAVREPAESLAILRKFKAGEITLQDAALEFAMAGIPLPEPIKILLAKTQPHVDAGPEEFGKSAEELEAELDAEYARKMSEIEKQEAEFIPKREQEVQDLKDELKGKDSFRDGIEAIIEKEKTE